MILNFIKKKMKIGIWKIKILFINIFKTKKKYSSNFASKKTGKNWLELSKFKKNVKKFGKIKKYVKKILKKKHVKLKKIVFKQKIISNLYRLTIKYCKKFNNKKGKDIVIEI